MGSKYIIVMCGDSPLFRVETLRSLMTEIESQKASAALIAAVLDNPQGYGRIVRNASREITGVAEEKLASDAEKAINEIIGGCYAFDADWLWANLECMRRNEAGEYCLTEMIDIAISQGLKVIAVPAMAEEVLGANTPDQLVITEGILRARE